jgi:hypothetical protein
MFVSLWRILRDTNPDTPAGRSRPASRRPSAKPCLELLEDRMVPAPLSGWVDPVGAGGLTPGAGQVGMTPPSAVSGLQPISYQPPGAIDQMVVTVVQNSPTTVINLRTFFGAMGGGQHDGGPRPAVLGNTNSGLVSTDLSGAQLTLSYAPGKCGEAIITVVGTYADGVSVQGQILVTVLPGPAQLPAAPYPPPPAR